MISIEYREGVESDLLDEFEQYFSVLQYPVERHLRKPSTYGVMEWALPALVVVWISKSFLDAFLKELGKDSAQQFKKILSAAYSRLRNKPNRAYTAADLRQMADGAAPESVGRACPAFKLQLEVTSISTVHTRRLSCVFPSGLSDHQVQDAIDLLIGQASKIVTEQAELLDNPHGADCPLAYVYVPARGWLRDIQLINEHIQNPKKA